MTAALTAAMTKNASICAMPVTLNITLFRVSHNPEEMKYIKLGEL